jgi:hypothetical protein
MRPRVSLSLALIAAATAAGCSGKWKKVEKESAERAPVAFPHSVHVEQGLECTMCHAKIESSSSLADANLPQTSVCKDCHDDKVAPKEPTGAPRLTFPHEIHVPQVEKCDHCHKKLPEPGQPRVAPAMAICTSCHNHAQDFAEATCAKCHVDLKTFDLVPETAFSHQGDWIGAHGNLARGSAATCASCHDQTYCAECHAAQTTPLRPSIRFPESVDRGFIHRGDYVSRHMVDAGANPASCARCHGTAFCTACHTLQGLTSQAANVRDPHPSGWTAGTAHGRAARNNILSCAGCHDNGADAICVACHRSGGVGGNPHPSRFLDRYQGEDRSKPPCSACHTN